MALTLAQKDRLGVRVLGCVDKGADSFARLRPRFPDLTNNELRAVVRHSRSSWLPVVAPGRRALIIRYQKLVVTGRTYSVICK